MVRLVTLVSIVVLGLAGSVRAEVGFTAGVAGEVCGPCRLTVTPAGAGRWEVRLAPEGGGGPIREGAGDGRWSGGRLEVRVARLRSAAGLAGRLAPGEEQSPGALHLQAREDRVRVRLLDAAGRVLGEARGRRGATGREAEVERLHDRLEHLRAARGDEAALREAESALALALQARDADDEAAAAATDPPALDAQVDRLLARLGRLRARLAVLGDLAHPAVKDDLRRTERAYDQASRASSAAEDRLLEATDPAALAGASLRLAARAAALGARVTGAIDADAHPALRHELERTERAYVRASAAADAALARLLAAGDAAMLAAALERQEASAKELRRRVEAAGGARADVLLRHELERTERALRALRDRSLATGPRTA